MCRERGGGGKTGLAHGLLYEGRLFLSLAIISMYLTTRKNTYVCGGQIFYTPTPQYTLLGVGRIKERGRIKITLVGPSKYASPPSPQKCLPARRGVEQTHAVYTLAANKNERQQKS